MPHPLVVQLRFTRSELQRALKGVSAEDAVKRLGPMNCISWIVGHLAWQEQLYWLTHANGETPVPEVKACGYGEPASTPDIDAMWDAWKRVTDATDPWLDTLDSAALESHTLRRVAPYAPYKESVGTRMRRVTYHYWYHIGEALAIRQMLGHTGLGDFVGAIGEKAPYVPE